MTQRYFTKDHEWIEQSPDGDVYMMGITNFAVDQLGDVVYLDLPPVGAPVKGGQECAVVESVKAASEIYAPVSGVVTAVNEAVVDDPATLNATPTVWLMKMKVEDPSELQRLMDETAYKAHTEKSGQC